MSLAFETAPGVQPAAANLQQTAADLPEVDPALAELPIVTVGQEDPLNPDRSSGFPNLLYHGTKADHFDFDETRNHRNAFSGTGARTGAGLYAGSETVSAAFGSGQVIELIPHDANLLDLDSPQARQPLSEELKATYIEDAHTQAFDRIQEHFPQVDPSVISAIMAKFGSEGRFIGHDDVRAVATVARDKGKVANFGDAKRLTNEIASQINTAKAIADIEGISIQELFAAHDPVNGETRVPEGTVFGIEPTIDFLTHRGIDGAMTIQKFDGEQAVVFWKLDKLGDRKTWERRRLEAPHDIGHTALADAGIESPAPESAPSPEQVLRDKVQAKVGEYIADHGLEDLVAGQPFEASARLFIADIRTAAKREGRDLTSKETQRIKDIVKVVNWTRSNQTN